MALDVATLLFPAQYATWGVAATLTPVNGVPVSVMVIDRTAGVSVTMGSGHTAVETVAPAAITRVSELTAAGIARRDTRHASLAFNGKMWRIEQSVPRPTTNGEDDGELLFTLTEVA